MVTQTVLYHTAGHLKRPDANLILKTMPASAKNKKAAGSTRARRKRRCSMMNVELVI
jgi:hypothetical protein